MARLCHSTQCRSSGRSWVREFVGQNAVDVHRGKNVYREWSDQDVREKLDQIPDEVELQSFRVFPILDATRFPSRRNIDEAYLICSYEPALGYPYTRVNLDGPTTGPK